MSNYTNNLFHSDEKNNSWVHLFELIPAKSRILDVGCSSGNFGEALMQRKHCEVIGLDIDKADISEAKKKLTAAYQRNVERESIEDLGTFDVVIFADVLEHLMDPIAALQKVKKQLNKGGRVVFSIPNMAHISVRLQIMEGFFEYTPIGVLDRTHLHYYDEIEVKHLFAEAGFAIQEMRPTMWTFPVSVISERLLRIGVAIHDKGKLLKTLDDTKAHVWQFIGAALPTDSKEKPAKRQLHYRMPPEELQLTLEARDRELTKLGEDLRLLTEENERLKHRISHSLKHAAHTIVHTLRKKRD